ncbi:MAG: SDR family oxidoreductase [Gammaproteobacteria bacterium]|nr:SDR family oxidoreductase [Gammaproteobacteria bacterium]
MLKDKVVLITGAANGIGQATALTVARYGAKVLLGDIDEAGGQATKKMINAAGGEAIFFYVNITDSKNVARFTEHAVEQFGRLDCAFNNAGIEGSYGTTAEYDEKEWDQVLDVNLKGTWLCMRSEIKHMLAFGGGAIVNASSALGKTGIWNMPAYVASKHAVIGLTRAAALDHAQQGIRVNAVAPGVIDTPMVRERIYNADPDAEANLLRMHPIGRIGTPEEVAEAVAWLCSDAASFVTGTTLSVDGAYMAK